MGTVDRQILQTIAVSGTVLYLIGFYSFLEYPNLAPNTYVSENALGIGYSLNMYNDKHLQRAQLFTKEYTTHQNTITHDRGELWSDATSLFLLRFLRHKGYEAYRSPFFVPESGERAWTVYATIRAPRGGGTEALFIGAQYSRILQTQKKQTSILGIAISLLELFHTKTWMSRDYHFIFTPAPYGDIGFNTWLEEYHSPSKSLSHFSRGSIWAGIHLEACLNISFSGFDGISILSEGAYGQLPNLDIVNTVMRVSLVEGVYNVGLDREAVDVPFLHGKQVEGLLTFMKNQGLGIPRGNHGMLSRYTIDGITLVPIYATDKPSHAHSMTQFGRIVEGTMISLNSIVEHLHQSFYFYLLPSPDKYISIGNYMISFALIIVGISIYHIYILLNANKEDLQYSISISLVAHIGSGIIFAFPLTLNKVVDIIDTWNLILILWLTLSFLVVIGIFSLFNFINHWLLYPTTINTNTKPQHPTTSSKLQTLKALSIFPLILFLSSFSLLNFSFSVMMAMITIPIAAILGHPQTKPEILKKIQTVILVTMNPLVILIFLTILLDTHFLQELFLKHFRYSTLFYPFLGLVYLPFNFISIYLSLV